MKWLIPAKTFLVGEYVAIAGGPAMLVTTTPCFEISITNRQELQGIHPHSPAGRFWQQQNHPEVGLQWFDPYPVRGGLGASSAQFLGAYWASMQLQKRTTDRAALLDAYWQHAWAGQGLPPSGYDIVAQSLHNCVYIDRQQSVYESSVWPFQDISFLLLHTGQKLATHQHLENIALPSDINALIAIVHAAKKAFDRNNSPAFIDAVNEYHRMLSVMHLVAQHSEQLIHRLKQNPDILAAKGCGAMGADVLLILVSAEKKDTIRATLSKQGWNVLATHTELSN